MELAERRPGTTMQQQALSPLQQDDNDIFTTPLTHSMAAWCERRLVGKNNSHHITKGDTADLGHWVSRMQNH